MRPFSYPKEKHIRTLNPRPYLDYRTYKPHLRHEFQRVCVYCRQPDGMRAKGEFGVDHYRPQKRFPALETVYSNLFYACNTCNSYKKQFWPTPAEKKSGRFIPNPCDHVMWDHLRFRGAKVEARSEAGRTAEKILFLNTEEVVQWREFVLQSTELWRERRGALKKTKRDIEARVALAKKPDDHARLSRGLKANARDIRLAERHLLRLGALAP